MSDSEETDIVPAPSSIVHSSSSIAATRSTLGKPVIPSESALANVTFWKLDLDTILDGLIPDPLPESSGKDNAIHHLNVIIFGKPNTGKTTLGESITQALARRYGQTNVKAMRSTRDLPALFENLDKLFGRFRKPPRAIVLFADDLTKALKKLSGTVTVKDSNGKLEKMRRVDYWLDKWYDIRGELFRRGMKQGLVVMVAGLHRFYGGDIDLRADADLLLVRSTGTPGTFDANKVEQMLGPVVYYAMRQHEVDALRDRKELAWTAFVAKTGSGLFRVPRPSVSVKWIMRNVGSIETSQELATDDESSSESSVLIKKPTIHDVPAKVPVGKSTVAKTPVVRPKNAQHRWRRGAFRAIAIAGALAVLYYFWLNIYPLLKA